MRIAGITKSSFVDWPGRIAAVLFTPGCNLDCGYCHNRQLVCGADVEKGYDPELVLQWLETRQGRLDGVVISGGEPTIQHGLEAFIRRVRALGFAIKLDTNGTRPQVVRRLIDEGLLDYVAMDVKAPIAKYETVCGLPVDQRALNETIDLLLQGRVAHEFRTTVLPCFTGDDLLAIARRVRGAQRLVLQQYRPVEGTPAVAGLICDVAQWIGENLTQLRQMVGSFDTRGFVLPQASGAMVL
jgi:pyruvate formate lyase activating enzyme